MKGIGKPFGFWHSRPSAANNKEVEHLFWILASGAKCELKRSNVGECGLTLACLVLH